MWDPGGGQNVLHEQIVKYDEETKARETPENQDSTCDVQSFQICGAKHLKWSQGRYTQFGTSVSLKTLSNVKLGGSDTSLEISSQDSKVDSEKGQGQV